MAKRGRPVVLTLIKIQSLRAEHIMGRTYKSLCAQHHIPYSSFNSAIKRYGLTDKQLRLVA